MCHKIRYDGESWKLFGFQGELNNAWVQRPHLLGQDKAVFSSSRENFLDTAAFLFVCGNYCPTMD